MLRVFVAILNFPETETSHVLQLGQRVLFEPVLAGCRGLYWTTLRPTNSTTAQEGFPCVWLLLYSVHPLNHALVYSLSTDPLPSVCTQNFQVMKCKSVEFNST